MIVVSLNGTEHEIRFVPKHLRTPDDDSRRNLMCSPCASGPPFFPSERYPCGNQACRIPIWVGVSILPRAIREDWSVLCLPCSLLAWQLDGVHQTLLGEESRAELRSVGLTDEQIDEGLRAAQKQIEKGEI